MSMSDEDRKLHVNILTRENSRLRASLRMVAGAASDMLELAEENAREANE